MLQSSTRTRTTRLLAGALLLLLLIAAVFIALGTGMPRGRLENIEYDANAAETKIRMLVYLPPGYPRQAPYPVLYLLHGAGDDETGWQKAGAVDAVLDRLCAAKRIVPMIVVMPNSQGRGPAFERDLREDVVPYVESHYAAQRESRGRAIAGVSLGGGQALSIGLKHSELFAWVGGFSPGLAGISESDLVGEANAGAARLKLLWISWGETDRLKPLCESLHEKLEAKKIPHVTYVGPGGHEERRNDLREFAQLLFRDEPHGKSANTP
jgi:enterochelin esterase-like enzyme